MKGGVFALGNFDGAHRGHRLVIDAAVAKARALNIHARVLTFEPHPRLLFRPTDPHFRLTPFSIKERILKSWGVDDVIALPFTTDFAQMAAQDFVSHILCDRLGAQHIVAGHDFTFGYQRSGDMAKLSSWLKPKNVPVTEITPLADTNGAFSSSRIREFLRLGETKAAAYMLGRDWSIAGTIMKGAQRGRTIGVPTANIELDDYVRPKFGVYAVRAGKQGEALNYRGVANIGVRPTVDGARENLEAHLFDFDRDIYGQEWEFALTHFIRPEYRFDSIEALKGQIAQDIEKARKLF